MGAAAAGQEAVAREVVFAAVDDHRLRVGQRSADGVGAAHGLAPLRARAQRHAVRAVGKAVVTHRLQHHAARVGQQQQAVRWPRTCGSR
jgi:hypothetical protein